MHSAESGPGRPARPRLTAVSLTLTAPEVPPSEVSGGGGSRSELVITWDVSGRGRRAGSPRIVAVPSLWHISF